MWDFQLILPDLMGLYSAFLNRHAPLGMAHSNTNTFNNDFYFIIKNSSILRCDNVIKIFFSKK